MKSNGIMAPWGMILVSKNGPLARDKRPFGLGLGRTLGVETIGRIKFERHQKGRSAARLMREGSRWTQ